MLKHRREWFLYIPRTRILVAFLKNGPYIVFMKIPKKMLFDMVMSGKLQKLDKDTDGSLNIAEIGSGIFKTDFCNLSFQLVSSSTTSDGTLDLKRDAIGFKVCKG